MPGQPRQALWSEQKHIAEETARLYRKLGIDDVSKLIGSSLGYAEGAASEAFRLFLVEADSDAWWFLDVAKRLAISAYDHDESYIYTDLDGRNSFAKFIAMRIVAQAQWLLKEHTATDSQSIALKHLLDSFEHTRQDDPQGASDPELTGRVGLHLAEAGRWQEIERLPARFAENSVWGGLINALKSAAVNVQNGNLSEARAVIDRWFYEHIGSSGSERTRDLEMTLIEAVVAARVRAGLGTVTEPIEIVKSIRWPEKA